MVEKDKDMENSVPSSSEERPSVKCQKIAKRHVGLTSEDSSRHMSLDSSRDSGIGENSNNSSDRSPSPTVAVPSAGKPTTPVINKPVLHIPEDTGIY